MYLKGSETFLKEINNAKTDPVAVHSDKPVNPNQVWHAEKLVLQRRKGILLIHEKTKFMHLIWPVKKDELQIIERVIAYTLQEHWKHLGLNWEALSKLDEEMGREIHYSTSQDEAMSEFIDEVSLKLKYTTRALNEENLNQTEMTDRLNTTAYTNPDGTETTPLDAFEVFLEDLGLGKDTIFTPPVAKLKVELELEAEPNVVRTILVPLTYTFADLHSILQAAFMWENYHLHQFEFANDHGINVRLVGDSESMSYKQGHEVLKFDKDIQLVEYLREKDTLYYEYDFGDSWQHKITVEEIDGQSKVRTALLVDMQGDAVPEDVGGASGYAHFKEVLADPDNELHDHFNAWSEEYRRRLSFYDLKWINHRIDRI